MGRTGLRDRKDHRAAIIFAALLFEDRDGPRAPVFDNLRGHASLFDPRTTHHEPVLALDETDLLQFQEAADFADDLLHAERVTRLHPILLTPGLYNRVHTRFLLEEFSLYHTNLRSVKAAGHL